MEQIHHTSASIASSHERILQHTVFGQQVRDALAHLHDVPYLQTHPLAQAIVKQTSARPARTGGLLHERLREAIDAQQPGPDTPATSKAWTRHQLLRLRYLDALDVPAICGQLGISHSEYYREHRRGLEAIVSFLDPEGVRTSASPTAGPEPAGAVLSPLGHLPARTALVGRQQELSSLCGEYDAVAAGGGGRLLLISGEPGVGKTRLVQELGVYARLRGGALLEGRYLREGTTPYGPWIDVLRGGLRGLSREDLAAAVGPYGSDLTQILPELGTELGPFPPAPRLTPEEQRQRLFDGVMHLLQTLSRRTPLVVLLDDLQWAPGLALLAHLAQHLAAAQVLLVGTYRDQEMREQAGLVRELADLNRARLATHLAVQPLAEAQTVQMVALTFGEQAAMQLGERVHRTTRGNAFFVEEVLRSLVESGAVRLGGQTWEVVDPSRVALPESVKLVVEERVGRLGENARDLLHQCAVLGQEFVLPVLVVMSGQDEDTVMDQVERALEARLLVDKSVGREDRFGFVDDQVQEVLYAGLNSLRRRRLHQRAGQALETVYADLRRDDHLEELVRHFIEGNDAEKAADYCYRAGRKADRQFAWSRSTPLYQTALELWEELGGHLEQRAAVCEQLGDAAWKSGMGHDRGIEYFERALALYGEAGNRRKQATIHSQIGREYTVASSDPRLRDNDKALEHFHAARTILEDMGDSVPLGLLYCGLAQVSSLRLDPAEGIAWGTKALELGERVGSPPVIVQAYQVLAINPDRAGKVAQAMALFDRAAQLASEHNLRVLKATGGNSARHLIAKLKTPRSLLNALDIMRRETTSQEAAAGTQHYAASQLCLVYALLGDFEQGMRAFADLQAGFANLQEPTLGFSPYQTGPLLVRRGDWRQAERLLQETIRQDIAGHRVTPTVHIILGELYLAVSAR